jgi:hypothetical protein
MCAKAQFGSMRIRVCKRLKGNKSINEKVVHQWEEKLIWLIYYRRKRLQYSPRVGHLKGF